MKLYPIAAPIRVKVTARDMRIDLQIYFCTAPPICKTPEAVVKRLNYIAERNGIRATYELATEEQYWAYRRETQTIIQKHKEG